jgi:hypothetical protein
MNIPPHCIICDEFLGKNLTLSVIRNSSYVFFFRFSLLKMYATRRRRTYRTIGCTALSACPGTYIYLYMKMVHHSLSLRTLDVVTSIMHTALVWERTPPWAALLAVFVNYFPAKQSFSIHPNLTSLLCGMETRSTKSLFL